MISHNKPFLSKSSVNAAKLLLNSKELCTGNTVKKFEIFFSKNYYRHGHSVLVSSGTAALFIAIQALKNKKKPKVLVPTYACSAILNSIYMANGIPIISDINENDFTLQSKKKIKGIDIVIAVNIFGSNPKLKILKKLYPKSKIILDACHSTGMKINKDFENLSYVDICIHSFYATKIVTCGHGGLIWSKNKKYINYCRDYIKFDLRKKYKPRFNFLLTDFQASILHDQIKKIEKIRNFRNKIFYKYLSSLPSDLKIFNPFNLNKDIVYRAVLIFKNKKKRDGFKKKLYKNKIESIIPVENFELLHNYLKFKKNKYKVAEKISSRTLSLPIHLSLKKNEVSKICKLIKKS